MQQGLPFEQKAITKYSTLKINFSANFYRTNNFFGGRSLNTPKNGKRKKVFTNINLTGCKTKKREGGVVTDKTGLKIFVWMCRK